MSAADIGKVRFREVLRPPFWLSAFIFFLLGSLALSIWAAFDNPAGEIALALAVLITFVASVKVAQEIELTETELHVGRAHIEYRYISNVEELNSDAMRLLRGRNSDPAAFLAIRFWQPRGVLILLNDPRDPTPYWLVSSKRAKELTQSLNSIT